MTIEGKGRAIAAIAGLVLGGTAVAVLAADRAPAPADRAAIEAIVREYILDHPEILPEAMKRLEAREVGKVIAANRAAIETPFAGAWAGAEKGDVVLVEYFDYACGYCRASVADVDRLLAEDPKLKVVFRELPILGPASDVAARASLAAAKQGRFLDFHHKLYAAGPISDDKVVALAGAAGIAQGALAAESAPADVAREIEKNIAMARTLNVTGTPSFVVGDRLLMGAVGYEELKAAVAAARAGRGS